MDIQLDQITSLVSLEIYKCPGMGLMLSNFTNPKLKEYSIEIGWDQYLDLPDDDLIVPFSFIKRFQGLETLVIIMPYQPEFYSSLLKVLADGISLAHNGTLRYLALLNALHTFGSPLFDTAMADTAMTDAVMACSHLTQLELPIGWGRKEMDLKVRLFSI